MHVPLNERLCFADCMNNGGTSSLYIDFTPNEAGQVGQVVRYVHDPDSFEVIAASFEDYLQQLIEGTMNLPLYTRRNLSDDATGVL